MFGLHAITLTLLTVFASLSSAAPAVTSMSGFCVAQPSTGGYCIATDDQQGGDQEWVFCGTAQPCSKDGASCTVFGTGATASAKCS